MLRSLLRPLHVQRGALFASHRSLATTTDASALVAAALDAAKPESQSKEKVRKAHSLQTRLRISPIKLRWVASQVSGLPYDKAVAQMQLSARHKAAEMVLFGLHAARGNAVHQFQADPSKLRIRAVEVGKGEFSARLRRHARGRMGRMHRPQCRLTIHVEEVDDVASEKPRNMSKQAYGHLKKANRDAAKAEKELARQQRAARLAQLIGKEN
eukprot:TRINITY_DN1249_c0_g1_i1.p1 TRINITY_DN1249_c0_g1~~TRINITY_DN1249_c0_g1_i1.p1  ORF type:complete len:227 (-),score=56.03 TRINITY_DN1249_c0_g1_i1:20-655(-)